MLSVIALGEPALARFGNLNDRNIVCEMLGPIEGLVVVSAQVGHRFSATSRSFP